MIGNDPWAKLIGEIVGMERQAKEDLLFGKPTTMEEYRGLVEYLRAVTEIKGKIGVILGAETSTFMGRE